MPEAQEDLEGQGPPCQDLLLPFPLPFHQGGFNIGMISLAIAVLHFVAFYFSGIALLVNLTIFLLVPCLFRISCVRKYMNQDEVSPDEKSFPDQRPPFLDQPVHSELLPREGQSRDQSPLRSGDQGGHQHHPPPFTGSSPVYPL